jgi:flagellum-specific ATP synthase
VELGSYERGTNPELDAALASRGALLDWMRQSEGGVPRADALAQLRRWQAALREAAPARAKEAS